ncbi:GDP-mannose dehydrogenase [Nitrosopumilus sp.]|nr:GDP-mannose dehydrogenase [Nitrosopumilus sp.]
MTDVILGMGEVGQTLFDLLVDRKFDCVGIDLDNSKCKKYSENEVIKNPEYLHICLPGELTGFTDIVLNWINKIKNIQVVIIHSTVKPGTTKIIQEKLSIPILFSPVRGVHKRFLNDIKKYTKFISFDGAEIDSKIKRDLENRFEKIDWMSTTKTAELAKILVDTTYYGWLINYAQVTKMICEKENIDFDEMWKFADEIHENLGNRPKMFPGIIGGHCVIPNLNLVGYENLEIIKKINEMYEKFKK